MVRRVVVVYKKSAYQLHLLERRDPHLRRLLRQGHPDVRDLRQARAVHQATLHEVVRCLKQAGLRHQLVYRAELRTLARADLVVTVGGDGTVPQASHFVTDQPVLGVNSDPARSEAVFCAATAKSASRVLHRVVAGTMPQRRLFRPRVRLNGKPVAPLVLNDVLIAHEDPATMSRYRLRVGARQETQKSSGVWIATAAGSSSAIRAAGGRPMVWTAKRFQYRPRELYQGRLSRSRLTGGVLSVNQTVGVTWLMREGAICIDGPHVRVPLRFGDRIEVRLSARHPLRLLGA